MKRLWVVSYDVACDRRRERLAQWLLGQGDRVLESVYECAWTAEQMPFLRSVTLFPFYECAWTAEQMPAMRARLAALIDPGQDRLRLAPVCVACREASVADGRHRGRAHACLWVV